MKFINLTPHEINIYSGEELIKTVPASGKVARREQWEGIFITIDGITITKQFFGAVQGVPDREEGVAYIVSRIVADALTFREDLYIPGPMVRDDNGKVIGCQGLSQTINDID